MIFFLTQNPFFFRGGEIFFYKLTRNPNLTKNIFFFFFLGGGGREREGAGKVRGRVSVRA